MPTQQKCVRMPPKDAHWDGHAAHRIPTPPKCHPRQNGEISHGAVTLSTATRAEALVIQSNTNDSHKCNGTQQKPDTKEYTWYGSIYRKLRNQAQLTCMITSQDSGSLGGVGGLVTGRGSRWASGGLAMLYSDQGAR